MQSAYAAETGIASLKIRQNNVLGYFVEVTNTHADKLLGGGHDRFIHRQTMANAVRFTTTELADLEARLSSAADKAVALEVEIFETLCREIETRVSAIGAAADAVARLDVAACLGGTRGGATIRTTNDRRFSGVRDRRRSTSRGGSRVGTNGEGAFVANGCDLSDGQRLWLLTGPTWRAKARSCVRMR